MNNLFFVKAFLTNAENKYSAEYTVECIANRESAFYIYECLKSKGFRHIDVRNCESGVPINFEYGIWGEAKPLTDKLQEFRDMMNEYSCKVHLYYTQNHHELSDEIEELHQKLIQMYIDKE